MILAVPGMDPKKFERIRDLVTVGEEQRGGSAAPSP